MLSVPRWRVILVIFVTIVGIVLASPNFLPAQTRAQIPLINNLQPINLGLDLQGGSHLLLEVDIDALIAEQTTNLADQMADALRRAEPRITTSGRGVVNGAARIRVVESSDVDRALNVLERQVNEPIQGSFGQTGDSYEFTLGADGLIEARFTDEKIAQIRKQAVDQSIEVIRRRIDAGGVSEVSITRQGRDRIIVQAPGEQDPETLKRRIGRTARMTFHLHDANVPIEDVMAGRAPPGTDILPQPNNPAEPFVAVRSRALLSGDDLADAQPRFDPQTGAPIVSFRFNNRGAAIFGRITRDNVNKRFAVVLDGQVITAPNINEPILGGSGQISGGFDVKEATELATLLRAGALPAPLTILEQRSVGPELGRDAIQSGSIAGMIAAVAVLAFMVLAYGLFGLIACVALIANMILILAAMGVINAALTLPGIAGLILTAAMAVDANVLIYERMREEAAAGRAVTESLNAGFSRAMVTIVDANLTTILAAGILLWLGGPGPVRGFAWTLSIGVVTSVFTAVLITQVLIAWWYRAARPKKLPI